MVDDKIKDEILNRTQEVFGAMGIVKDNSGKGVVCPLCGSGTGKHGTGMTTKDGIHYTCWACGEIRNADIFEIVGKTENVSEFKEQKKIICDILGIEYSGKQQKHTHTRTTKPIESEKPVKNNNTPNTQKPENEAIKTDYSNFFLQAHKNIENTDYHRGLSREVLDRFNIGYVSDWRHPDRPNSPPSPRLIIPTSKYSYLARDTRAEIPEYQRKYAKQKVGNVEFFNMSAVNQTEKPVFIVEGEIDAMSVIQAGGEAVGLGSTSNVERFVKQVTEQVTLPQEFKGFLICLDADKAGDEASDKLYELLKKKKIRCAVYALLKKHADPNAEFMLNRKAFCENVQEGTDHYEEYINGEEIAKYRTQKTHLATLLTDIEREKETVQTGFAGLDDLLDGGLYTGLYFIGAISSLGKTTFCLQIGEQIALQSAQSRAKIDVLIFSLEMATSEIIAKGLSRNSFIISSQDYNTDKYAKTTRGVLTRWKYRKYEGERESEVFDKAVSRYNSYLDNLYIVEGVGNVGIKEVRGQVEKHIKTTGHKPIVIIDYIQILAPFNERSTDKQNTDKAVMELKRISRDFDIPIIGISSFNRDNYDKPVGMASFKESGAVEYSSDVLMGLQYKAQSGQNQVEARMTQTEKGNKGDPQDVELIILKNRNGRKGKISLRFYPKFNYFEDFGKPPVKKDEDDW